MNSVATYLHFDGNCRQAMSFYRQCLGAELQLNAYPDAKGQPSSDPSAKIMHGQLSRGGSVILMASDGAPHGGAAHRLGNNFSISLDCDSQDEAGRVVAALGQNGQVRMPLGRMPWGAHLGMLTDQFGIQWMISCN